LQETETVRLTGQDVTGVRTVAYRNVLLSAWTATVRTFFTFNCCTLTSAKTLGVWPRLVYGNY